MSMFYSSEQLSMLEDKTTQEGTSMLVTKVRFENKTASFKESSTGCVLPHPHGKQVSQTGTVQARAVRLYRSAQTCHSTPDSYVSSSLHWQRPV